MNDEGVSGSHAVGIEGGLAALEDQLDLPLEAVEGINDGRGNLQVCEIPVVVVFRLVPKAEYATTQRLPILKFFYDADFDGIVALFRRGIFIKSLPGCREDSPESTSAMGRTEPFLTRERKKPPSCSMASSRP